MVNCVNCVNCGPACSVSVFAFAIVPCCLMLVHSTRKGKGCGDGRVTVNAVAMAMCVNEFWGGVSEKALKLCICLAAGFKY